MSKDDSSQNNLAKLRLKYCILSSNHNIVIMEHLISWVEPNFFKEGGEKMNKKDFLILSLVMIIFLLVSLLFIVLL